MAKILVDVVEGKEVWIEEELEAIYLRFRRYFKGVMIYIDDGSTMIEQLVEYMTTTDLLTTSSSLTFELVHNLYVKNLLNLYEVSNYHELFLNVDILAEVEKILEGIAMGYIRFEVLNAKVDKRFYRIVNNLMAEAIDEYEIEDTFFDFLEVNDVLNHKEFIKYVVSYNMFNRLEYHETRSLAFYEVLLEVIAELTRMFKESRSSDSDVLEELIGYAPDIADTVYNEVYRH